MFLDKMHFEYYKTGNLLKYFYVKACLEDGENPPKVKTR